MAEAESYGFTHRELVEILVKEQDIHEGIWGLSLEFGLRAANLGGGPEDLAPTAMVGILKIGIRIFKEESAIAIDAAKVNPSKPSKRSPRKKSKR